MPIASFPGPNGADASPSLHPAPAGPSVPSPGSDWNVRILQVRVLRARDDLVELESSLNGNPALEVRLAEVIGAAQRRLDVERASAMRRVSELVENAERDARHLVVLAHHEAAHLRSAATLLRLPGAPLALGPGSSSIAAGAPKQLEPLDVADGTGFDRQSVAV